MTAGLLVVLICGGVAAATTGRPPRPGTELNGLTENESATLWSRDVDSDAISNAQYRDAYGESRTAIQALANRTDITFTAPPATAATWTRNDFTDLDLGGPEQAVHPANASRTDEGPIRDAGASIFTAGPATVVHESPTTTTRYLAPKGTLRGAIDYRVAVPESHYGENKTIEYTLEEHRIASVTVSAGGQELAQTAETKRPTLGYQLPPTAETLRLEARITATVTVDVFRVHNGTAIEREETRTTSITVADTLAVTPYQPRITTARAVYPNGTEALAATTSQPWRTLTTTDTADPGVQNVWRFYTARDPAWSRLTARTATDRRGYESPALPVVVHAFPATQQPQVTPPDAPVTRTRQAGTTQPSPASTLPSQVHVGVVTEPYQTTQRLHVQGPPDAMKAPVATGLVRDVPVTVKSSGEPTQLQPVALTAQVTARTPERATLRVRLETERGTPIDLTERDGTIRVAGRQVATNASGMATVIVTDPSLYTARYVPGSWQTHDPAYVGATATARWHPLTRLSGWVALLGPLVQLALVGGVIWYAGRRAGRLLRGGVLP